VKVPFASVIRAVLIAVVVAAAPSMAQQKEFTPQSGQDGKDVMWVPTPDEVVERMLDLAQVQAGDRLVDLGSGDGKIVIAAAKRSANAKGIEYNPDMVAHSQRVAQKAGVKVELVQGDIFKADFTNADVVTMYLMPHLNLRLRPTLLKMKPGTRVVSHAFDMGEWTADNRESVGGYTVYFWRVPANVEGTWRFSVGNNPGPTVKIEQSFQFLKGEATWGDRTTPLTEATVQGARVVFVVTDPWGNLLRFEGNADHKGPMMGVATPYAGGAQRLFVGTRIRQAAK
jgi:SAM-dependent methyltransferase